MDPTVRKGLADFLEKNFDNMICGVLVLNMQRSREHSLTIATVRPVSKEVMGQYVEAWNRMSFLDNGS
jgi:hypothetical protein